MLIAINLNDSCKVRTGSVQAAGGTSGLKAANRKGNGPEAPHRSFP